MSERSATATKTSQMKYLMIWNLLVDGLLMFDGAHREKKGRGEARTSLLARFVNAEHQKYPCRKKHERL